MIGDKDLGSSEKGLKQRTIYGEGRTGREWNKLMSKIRGKWTRRV